MRRTYGVGDLVKAAEPIVELPITEIAMDWNVDILVGGDVLPLGDRV